jgi:hypothetical protein
MRAGGGGSAILVDKLPVTAVVMQHYEHLREAREHLKHVSIQAARQFGQMAVPAFNAG